MKSPLGLRAGRSPHGQAGGIAARFPPPFFAGRGAPPPRTPPRSALRADGLGTRGTSARRSPIDRKGAMSRFGLRAGCVRYGRAGRLAARFLPPSFARKGTPPPRSAFRADGLGTRGTSAWRFLPDRKGAMSRFGLRAGCAHHGRAGRLAARFLPPSFARKGTPPPRSAFRADGPGALGTGVPPFLFDRASTESRFGFRAGCVRYGQAGRVAARFRPPSFARKGTPPPRSAFRADGPGVRGTGVRPSLLDRAAAKSPFGFPAPRSSRRSVAGGSSRSGPACAVRFR